MKAIIIDSAPFQRKILAMLLESQGISEITEYDSLNDVTTAADDLLFVEAPAASAPLAADGIVIVTAPEKDDAVLAKHITAGAAAFLPKPFTPERLKIALRDAGVRA